MLFYRNGDPTNSFDFKITSTTKFNDIKKFANDRFNSKYEFIRLFNAEGVEIMEDDLEFIKNNSVLFISKGEDFDYNSSFA